jgi:hypothetical protein
MQKLPDRCYRRAVMFIASIYSLTPSVLAIPHSEMET